ncbi:hypothetical protein FALCPG4_009832 [Fusarium falciforme]
MPGDLQCWSQNNVGISSDRRGCTSALKYGVHGDLRIERKGIVAELYPGHPDTSSLYDFIVVFFYPQPDSQPHLQVLCHLQKEVRAGRAAEGGDLTKGTRDTLTNSRRPALTQDHFAETVVVCAGKYDHSRNRLSSVARDRNWFSDDYVPFQTRIHDSRGIWFEAVGIGTVVLPIVQSEGERGEIILKNVLHYPDAVCNIVGSLVSCGERVWTLRDDKMRPAVYFELGQDKPFHPLLLSGPPCGARLGRCPLDEKRNSLFGLYLPENERERFEVSQGRARVSQEEEEEDISVPLTDHEKAWLKKYWRSEFQFLAAYALSIYHEGDRSVGRDFLRQFMAEDKKHKESHRYDMSEDEGDFFDEPGQDGLEFGFMTRHDPDAHVADRHFSDDELAWIQERHGDSRTFLASNWLRFYNDDDCQEGKELAQQLMRRGAETREAYGLPPRRYMAGETLHDSR